MRLHREAWESFKGALDALWSRKTRGFLTTLGIMIGIVGVSATMTTAHGLSNSFKESVSSLGTDVLYVSRMPWVIRRNFFEFRNRPEVTLKDARKLESRLPGAVAVNPTIHTDRSVKYQSSVISNVGIIGTTDKHILVSDAVPEFGRFITGFDVQSRKAVCVIGSEVRLGLFEGVDPLNKTIRIGRHGFRVVGIMEKQGNASFFDGPNFDAQIYVPVTSFVKTFGGTHRDFDIAVKAPALSSVVLDDFQYEVVGEMRKIRRLAPTEDENFTINKMDALMGMFTEVMGKVVLVGLIVTGISLFVGGIGVMNIMFVSVTERTREIGVRKALGATKRAILSQFLFESSMIGLVGGLAGLLAAYGVTAVIDRLLLPSSISLPIVLTAIAVSVLVGVLSGFIPAWRAARMNPVEALRYE